MEGEAQTRGAIELCLQIWRWNGAQRGGHYRVECIRGNRVGDGRRRRRRRALPVPQSLRTVPPFCLLCSPPRPLLIPPPAVASHRRRLHNS